MAATAQGAPSRPKALRTNIARTIRRSRSLSSQAPERSAKLENGDGIRANPQD